MGKLNICVYAICKNEAKFVDGWMDSMGEADQVIVTDTGSVDGTAERLQARGAVVYQEEIHPWRFDLARNRSLAHVPEDADVCVCTDLDERFVPGWREKLEAAWLAHKPSHPAPVAKTGRYLYNWSLRPDGSPDVQFYYFKVHARRGFRWKCPVHEFLEYLGETPLETVYIDGMVLNHYPDPEKSRGSYLPLLELAVEEAPEDDRMRYYLGREYLYQSRWQACIDTLFSYLALPTARWNEERCAAMRWIAKSYGQLGQGSEADRWFLRAIAEAPFLREPYVEFAALCYERGDWPMAFLLAKEALKIQERSKTFVNTGYAWDHTPDDLCAIAAYHMGLMEEAYRHTEQALRLAPAEVRLHKNLAEIKARLRPE